MVCRQRISLALNNLYQLIFSRLFDARSYSYIHEYAQGTEDQITELVRRAQDGIPSRKDISFVRWNGERNAIDPKRGVGLVTLLDIIFQNDRALLNLICKHYQR